MSNYVFKHRVPVVTIAAHHHLFSVTILFASCSALHMLMQHCFVSYSSYKISRQQDILLRNVAGITAAADFSGRARSCPMAPKLSEHCHRAEWGPLHTPCATPI